MDQTPLNLVLRILAMDEAKFVNTQSIKNLRRPFFNNAPLIGKMKSKLNSRGGRGEIENVTRHDFDIFNFTSTTRCQFSNVSTLFTSMDPLSKKFASDFRLVVY